jgi:hypothetical protein
LLLFLSRKAPVVSLLLASSGCVIPVVPEFEDPPAAENVLPVVRSPNPEIGIQFGARTFSARVLDPNPGDPLFLHWVADLQTGSVSVRTIDIQTVPPRVDGKGHDEPTFVDVNCGSTFLDKSLTLHSIHLLAGDAPFEADNPRRLTSGDAAVEVAWTLNLPCP